MGAPSKLNLSAARYLEEILAPHSCEDFLKDHYGKSFVRIPGNPGKFSNLLPWNRLNEILEFHQFPPENLRILNRSESLSEEKYVQTASRPRRLDSAEIANVLADGATIFLGYVDDLDPVVRTLAVNFERIFRTVVWVNMYAGWGTERGLDLHWDEHHTLILQVHGKKRWQVYGPTRPHPFKDDAEKAEPPAAPPVWEGVLEEGALIHIPRGWWHVAVPLGEPCMHLTVGFSEPTGVDLVRWLGRRVKTFEIARKEIPRLAGPEDRSAYVNELWQAIQASWTPDILDRFLASAESEAPRRPDFHLPFGPVANQHMLEMDAMISLASPFRLDLSGASRGSMISFKTFGRNWNCPEVVIPALEALNDGEAHRVTDLCGLASDVSGSFQIVSFLSALAMDGVIVRLNEKDPA